MKVKRVAHQSTLFERVEEFDKPEIKNNKLPDNIDIVRESVQVFTTDLQTSIKSSTAKLSQQEELRFIQKQFDELHEELYRKGGVKPANAAIDELSKLIFLKFHTEKYPDYQLNTGEEKKLFKDIFNAEYIRANGKKAVREMQDAFREISTLPCYLSYLNDETQSIFPYQETLRLEHPDVLAMAVEILYPMSLSVPDADLLNNAQMQWNTLAHQDLLGSAYDIFLRGKYDSAGGLGTYLTPNQVVDCMVEMAFNHISDHQLWAKHCASDKASRHSEHISQEDLPDFLVGDICCGTGRFLVRALAETRDRILNAPNKSAEEKLGWLAKLKKFSFFGADQSASSTTKARINFLLFGESHPHLLTVEDSILDERVDHLANSFDLILTNPPFGEGKYTTPSGLEKMRQRDLDLQLGWSWKVGEEKMKPLNRADPCLLFIDRNLQLLKPGGLLFIVLPDGILESAYAYAHHYLLEKADLKAVVSLPKDTFAITGTVAKTSFICLQKKSNKDDNPKTTFMAVANHVGYLKKGPVEVPDPEGNDLPKIAAIYKDFIHTGQTSYQELSHDPMVVAVPNELLDDSLTAHRYHFDRRHAEKAVGTLSNKASRLQDVVRLAKSKPAFRTSQTSYFISILHIDERSNIDWETASTYKPTSKGLRCLPNDILFSCLNPSKVRVAVIPNDIAGEVLCSMEFAILRPNSGEDPYFISLALKTQTSQRQILPLARGTSSSRRRVRDEDLLSILIPYPDASVRKEISTQFREAIERSRNALKDNSMALSKLEALRS